MGFFSNKKGAKGSPNAPLSEAEIHRKLYGEFEAVSAHTVSGEREHLKDPVTPAPSKPKEPSAPSDLFSVSRDAMIEPEVPKRPLRPMIKSPESSSRHVPIQEFEKKTVPDAGPVDAYARFRSGISSGKMKFEISSTLKKLFESGGAFVVGLFDPRRVMVRRVFYWSSAVLVVFLLFWGVNVLNSQREEAMKSQPKNRRELPSVTIVLSEPARPAVANAKTVATERPVVITPAPPRASSREVVITPAVPAKRKIFPVSSSRPYVIQVVTYPGLEDAARVVETLKNEKLEAFSKEYKRASGRVYYVVFIGGYRTEAEAQSHLVKFRAKEVARPFQDAFVRTI